MIKTQSLNSFINLAKDTLNHFSKIKSSIFKIFGLIALLTIVFDFSPQYMSKVFEGNFYVLSLSMLVYVIYIIFNAILIVGFISSLKKKKSVSIKRAFNRGLDLLVPSIWVGMIMFIAQVGAFSLFIIPGIILTVYLAFAKISVLIDGKRGIDSLVYSFNIVRGYWFKIVWKMFIGSLTLLITISFIGIILALIPVSEEVYAYMNTVLAMLVMVPLQLIYTYHLYQDVKSKPRVEIKFKVMKVINFAIVVGSMLTILISSMVIYLI